jgi:hypothetical protein
MALRAFCSILISMILCLGPVASAQTPTTTPVKYLVLGGDPANQGRQPGVGEEVVVAEKAICDTAVGFTTGKSGRVKGCYAPKTAAIRRVDNHELVAIFWCGNEPGTKGIVVEGKVVALNAPDYQVLIRQTAEATAEAILAKMPQPVVNNTTVNTGIDTVEVRSPEGVVLDKVESDRVQPGQPATKVVVTLKNAPAVKAAGPTPTPDPASKKVVKKGRCGKGCVIGIVAAVAGAAAGAAFLGGRSGSQSGCNTCSALPPTTRP